MQQSKSPTRLFRDYRHLTELFYSGVKFVAFDTETTGLRAESDFILEIGAVKFDCNGIIGESFDTLIKPPVSIPPFITQLTHIDDNLVKDEDDESVVLPDFMQYILDKDTILVAHNAPFDVGFVNASLTRLNLKPLHNMVIDTLPLSRWAYPELALEKVRGQYKLQTLAKRFNIDVYRAHRADDDARVCMELLKKIMQDTAKL